MGRAKTGQEPAGNDEKNLAQLQKAKWAADVEPLLANADSGDVVLINRDCFDCSSWYGAFICAVTKEASSSKWNDVGLVVRDSHGEPQLLCATLRGVALTPLREQVYWWKLGKTHAARSLRAGHDGTEVVLRSLEYPRTPELRAQLEAFARSMVGAQCKQSFSQLLWSVVNAVTVQDRERLEVLRKTAQTHLAEIERQLQDRSHEAAGWAGLVHRSLTNERHRLQCEIQELERSITVRDKATSSAWFSGARDLGQAHSAELVARALLSMGLLETFPPASSYSPASFSADGIGKVRSDLRMLKSARLGGQMHLTPYAGADAVVPGSPRRPENALMDPSRRQMGAQGDILFALQRDAVLSTLEPDDILALVDAFEPCQFADGDTIFERPAHGDFSDANGEGAWVTVKGQVRSYRATEDGGSLEIAEHAVGELLGTDDALSGLRVVRRQHSATCHDEAGCEVWRCSRGRLWTLLRQRLKPAVLRDVHSRMFIEHAIKDHFLFANLAPAESRTVINSFAPVVFKAGEVAFREGDTANYMYILESGEMEVWKEVPANVVAGAHDSELPRAVSRVKVDTMRSGAIFGEMGLVFEAKRNSTVVALSDCVLWAHGRQDLVRLGQARPIRKLFDENASAKDRRGDPCMTRTDFLRCIPQLAAHSNSTQAPEHTRSNGLVSIRQHNAEVTGELMLQLADSNRDGLIDFVEFLRVDMLLNKPQAQFEICFRLADIDHTGTVSRAEFEQMWQTLRRIDKQLASSPPEGVLNRFDEKGELRFDEFCQIWSADDAGAAFAKQFAAAANKVVSGWSSAVLHPTAHHAMKQQSDSELIHLDPETPWRWRILGLCVSTAVAHTVVAPLDRLKIMQQALGPRSLHDTRWMGFRGIFSMWETEGLRGLWRGHTASLLRIAPLIALNSYLFGLLRPVAVHYEQGETRYPKPLSWLPTLLVSGTAGMAAQAVVHPLDVLRARMCVQTRGDVVSPRFCPQTPGQFAGLGEFARGVFQRRHERNHYNPSMYDTRSLSEAFRQQMRVGGARGLWRGAAPAMIGAGLWTGVSFTIHDSLLPLMPREADGSGEPQAVYAMTATLWASRIAQAVAYPFDTLKRSMQCAPPHCTTHTWVEYRALVAEGGHRALFRGFPVMLSKIGPSVTVSYFTYHWVIGFSRPSSLDVQNTLK